MKKIFYLLSRLFNYSSSIAIFSAIIISIILITEIYILNLFMGGVFELVVSLMNLSQNYIFLGIVIIYFILFGILSPLKLPAGFKFLRNINNNFKKNLLNPDISDDDLKKLYSHLTNIPIYNTIITSILLIIGTGVTVFTGYLTIKSYGSVFLKHLMEYIRTSMILHGFVMIIIAVLTYVLTDTITTYERALCYNELWKRNYFNRPKSYLRLRIKFNTIALLMLISLSAFLFIFIKKQLYMEIDMSAFLIYFLASISAAIIIVFITANSILRIFRDISRVAKDITKGLNASFHVLPLEGEFADIEYLILSMDKEILEHRRDLEAKVAERTEELRKALSNLKERDDLIQKQLDMAGSIQRSIFPGKINDWNELKFSVKYFSMDKIGGDFYDVHQIDGNKLALYVADVSGHGIPAALVSTMAKVSFGNAFIKYNTPKKIFREVNQDLLTHIKTQDYLTCFMALIDDEYNVTYSNASHQKGIILRSAGGTVEQLDTGGLFLGAIEDARETYEEKITKLNYGDRLILFTDGIPEATNSAKEHYTNEKFEKNIIRNRGLELKEFTNSIIEDLQNFISGSKIQDDITLLVIELKRDETIDIVKNIKILTDEKEYKKAIDILKAGLEQYPDNQKLLYNLAKTYLRTNEFSQVIKIIKKYIEKDKDNKFAYYLAGAASYKISDYGEAIGYFQQALAIDPNFVNALFALGMSFKDKGMKDDAGRCFEKVKNIDEDNKLVDYELEQLKTTLL
jgi:phosphoserine phosphatase RsbU/P